MGADYDQVVAALPRLTPEERARVCERLKMLGALAPAQALAAGNGRPPDDDAAGELLEVIAAAVLRLHGERAAPAALRRAPTFPAFAAKARELSAFSSAHARGRPRRRALLALGVELLYRDLRRAGMTVTSRTLMQCAHQLPAVLDRAFPGYARSGKLGMVVGQAREVEEDDPCSATTAS